MAERDLDKLRRLLDYNLSLDDAEQRQETERLLATDPEAQRINSALKRSLKPLTAWPEQAPRPGLAERTMQFIKEHRQAQTMEQVSATLARRRDDSTKETVSGSRGRWIFSNLRDVIAVAAGIAIIVLLSQPALRHARQLSHRQSCANQMRQAGVALAQYTHDHNGFLPYISHQPGAIWWNVGKQDGKNTSNTRSFFLLVKQGYLPARVFVCPAVSGKAIARVEIEPKLLKQMQDFASRRDVTYSFRLMFDNRNRRLDQSLRTPMMSDQNPLFAQFDGDSQRELDLSRNTGLLRANSPNHNGSGQNVLHPDGRVDFIVERHLNGALDDIFTIKSALRYRGNEVPQSRDDIFIVP